VFHDPDTGITYVAVGTDPDLDFKRTMVAMVGRTSGGG
jgi:hypothetical protein